MNGFMTPGPFKSILYLGMVVNVSLTGSHTNASYPTKVVYINQTSTIVHLLGTTNLGNANFTTARAYRWTATLTLGNLSYTINNCMNPTSTQIMTYCSGYKTGFTYWCNDNVAGSSGWYVYSNGAVYNTVDAAANADGVLPYIIVNL